MRGNTMAMNDEQDVDHFLQNMHNFDPQDSNANTLRFLRASLPEDDVRRQPSPAPAPPPPKACEPRYIAIRAGTKRKTAASPMLEMDLVQGQGLENSGLSFLTTAHTNVRSNLLPI